MIYFLKNPANNMIKIGRTKELTTRRRALQTGNAHSLEFVYIIDTVDDSCETFIHEICARYHVSGEWFSEGVLDNHLLKHPWYAENMKTYAQWIKERANAIRSSDASTSVASRYS